MQQPLPLPAAVRIWNKSAYVQDAIRLGNWSIDAGLRWDHYQLLVNQNAVSPRVAISRYFPSAGVKVHVSYDRIFQTPSFENILLSSSPAAEALDTSVPAVQLPVQPSHGNYYELGATKAFFGKAAAGYEHVPPRCEQLRRRLSGPEYGDQLPHRIQESHSLWRGGQA